MNVTQRHPPRTFIVGRGESIEMCDCGSIELAANEQVTFVEAGGVEYDVARKEWGFYATPSLNSRVLRFGMRGALVRNALGHYFVLLVQVSRMAEFIAYLALEQLVLVCWMDDMDALSRLEKETSDA